jgi:hypothetical protein
VTDEHGSLTKDHAHIMGIFRDHMTRKYGHIQIDEGCMRRIVCCGVHTVHMTANCALEEPVTLDELLAVVRKGKECKSSGRDGICNEFFKTTWEVTKQEMLEIIDHMYIEGEVTEAQKQSIILCMSKKTPP